MTRMQKIRALLLATPSQLGRELHVAAASGLARLGPRLYVIADDELHLGLFSLGVSAPGTLYRIFDGELPLDHENRKQEKPDLEALTLLEGSLLAVPSGSKGNRVNGALISLDAEGTPTGDSRLVNFAPLYAHLTAEFGELNIEGVVVTGPTLRLFQRGNGNGGTNATIDLNLELATRAIRGGVPLGADLVVATAHHDLGKLRGIPLSFTDAAALDDGTVVFLAAAEDSDGTYDDGPCTGSVIGVLSPSGKVTCVDEIKPSVKAEGLVATRLPDGSIEALVVTDDDNDTHAASLFRAVFTPPRDL